MIIVIYLNFKECREEKLFLCEVDIGATPSNEQSV